jgi:hypothetical protein
MALFFECMLLCAQKVLDTADMVREAMFRQLHCVEAPTRENSSCEPKDLGQANALVKPWQVTRGYFAAGAVSSTFSFSLASSFAGFSSSDFL